MAKKKFIIKDWMNNTCFEGKEFKTFEEGWDFIYENDPNPLSEEHEDYDSHYYDDYSVEQK